MPAFWDIDNMHKKFRSDISNIVNFFLLSNFWWSFSFFQWNQKQRNDHQKLDNRKKSKIFEMSLQIFLCKLLITKNSSSSNLESKVAFSLAPWWKICTVILTSIFFLKMAYISFSWKIHFDLYPWCYLTYRHVLYLILKVIL